MVRPSLAAVRLQVRKLEARALFKLGISDGEDETMPAVKRLHHEAILRDRAAGMTHAALAEKYGAARSTIAWHLRQNDNGEGPREPAPEGAEVAQRPEARPNGHAVESPANGHAIVAEAGGDLAELGKLADQHWQFLTIVEKVRALLNTYTGSI